MISPHVIQKLFRGSDGKLIPRPEVEQILRAIYPDDAYLREEMISILAALVDIKRSGCPDSSFGMIHGHIVSFFSMIAVLAADDTESVFNTSKQATERSIAEWSGILGRLQ